MLKANEFLPKHRKCNFIENSILISLKKKTVYNRRCKDNIKIIFTYLRETDETTKSSNPQIQTQLKEL